MKEVIVREVYHHGTVIGEGKDKKPSLLLPLNYKAIEPKSTDLNRVIKSFNLR